MSNIRKANLPLSPFDGQEYVDFRGIKWKFSAKDDCWRSAGVATTTALANTEEPGLLSPIFKRLLDTLPEKAGGFGILARPLLSVVPLRRKPLYKGSVVKAFESNSGSAIQVPGANFAINQYAGKLVFFGSGVLKDTYYVIFTNSADTLYMMGKESSTAKKGDKFEILEAGAINENGAIQGDIKLVSETLDISCVTGDGQQITTTPGCPPERIFVDDPLNPPGIDIRVNDTFLDQFCVTIPGCSGPDGDRGEKGLRGADGTGDGPKGEPGDPGLDAPPVGNTFTGVKINDIDDVYDTAVVAFEFDAAAGKLYVVKAKIKVPDDNRPAERVIANSLNRDVVYTGNDFDYEILMPSVDPINVADVELMHYPESFVPQSTEAVRTNRYEPNVIKLSKFIDSLNDYYQVELSKASIKYDEEIRPFIEKKDDESRKILSELADDVAKCEWDMPIEFCLGISPEVCNPQEKEKDVTPFPLAEAILGPSYAGAVATPPTEYTIRPTPVTPPPLPPPNNGPPGTAPVPPPTPSPPVPEPFDPNPPVPVPGDPVIPGRSVPVTPPGRNRARRSSSVTSQRNREDSSTRKPQTQKWSPGDIPPGELPANTAQQPGYPAPVYNPETGELEERSFYWTPNNEVFDTLYPNAPNVPGGLPLLKDANGNFLDPKVDIEAYQAQILDYNQKSATYKASTFVAGQAVKVGDSKYKGTGVVKVYDPKGNSLIQPSTLLFVYKDGAARGDTAYTADMIIKYKSDTDSGEAALLSSDSATLNNFSYDSFVQSNKQASTAEISAAIVLTNPSEVAIEFVLPSNTGVMQGEVTVQMYQIFTAENVDKAPVPLIKDIGQKNQMHIFSVQPHIYGTGGGEIGEIIGSGFDATGTSLTVLINDVKVSSSVISATKVEFTTNALPPGVYHLTVVDGDNFAFAANAIEVVDTSATNPLPYVTSISGAYGIPEGGESVTIVGGNFGAQVTACDVQIGTQSCTILSWSDTSITITTPPSLGGGNIDPYDVTIITGDNDVVTVPNGFTYYVDTDIQSVSPDFISSAVGGNITISGTYFGAATGSVTISNLTTPAAPATLSISLWTDTQIIAVVNIGTPIGQYSLTVARNDSRDSEINSPSIRVIP